MRIAVCDDIESEREKTINALKKVTGGFVTEEFDDGRELLKRHAENPYDLIMLDIIMPEISGMDTAERLRETDKKTPIVFISTSEEFGVQSYRVLAFDYLTKPIDIDRLSACMKRLGDREKENRYLTISYSGTKIDILLSNIQCLESNLRKVVFTLSENREIEVVGKLSDFEAFLTANGFCRCHKSYIVNIGNIDSIDGDNFILTGKKSIKISRPYLQSAKKAYFNYVFSAEVR